jgi:hypothetical protein
MTFQVFALWKLKIVSGFKFAHSVFVAQLE